MTRGVPPRPIEYPFVRKFAFQFSSRALSTLFGIALSISLIRFLNNEQFALYQVCFVAGALIGWLLDFGLVGAFINFRVRSETSNALICCNSRFLIMSLITVLTTFFWVSFRQYSDIALLVYMAFIDTYSDNFMSARQLFTSSRHFVITSVGKKVMQLLLFFSSLHFYELSLSSIAFSMILPNIIVIVFDLFEFPVRGVRVSRLVLTIGLGNWFQSGGTVISQLDNVIAFAKFEDAFLKVIASSRRISSGIGLVGSAYSPHILASSGNANRDLDQHVKRVLRLSVFVMLFAVLPILVFARLIFQSLFGIELKPNEIWTVYAIIGIIPFGIVSANLNAILVGNRKFIQAACATYVSSFIYLILLFQMGDKSTNWFAFGVVLNLGLEIGIELFFICKYKILSPAKSITRRGTKCI